MADTILTLKQIEDFFRNITAQMLELDISLPENHNKVRISWSQAGTPAWKQTDDIVFLRLNNPDDPINRQRDVLYSSLTQDNINQTVSYTRVHTVKWILYGPNSYDNAETIRNALFLSQYQEQINAKNLYLVLDVIAPARFPELFNGQWWDRTDFEAQFNELVTRRETIPTIKTIDVQTVISS